MESKNPINVGWIVVSFIFVQPLGMLLLCLRFLYDKKESLKHGRTILKTSITFFVLFLIFLFTDTPDMEDFLYSLYLFGGGALIGFVAAYIMIRRGRKYEKYRSAVEMHKLVKLQSIADAVKLPVETVTQDLLKMIEVDFFPDARVNLDERTFILNAAMQEEEKTKTVRCTGCGATAVAVSSRGTVCEYCGAPVNY